MNYVYYPDYLEHHGILGMKWGVRRYQNKDGSWTNEGLERRKSGQMTAREYQQRLRQLDKRLQRDVIGSQSSLQKSNSLSKKLGKDDPNPTERELKIKNKAERYKKQSDILSNDMRDAAEEFYKILDEVEANGMTWKSRPTNFNQPIMLQARKLVKEKSGMRYKDIYTMDWFEDLTNASSGNRITVRDKSSLTEKQQRRYENNKNLQSYRGQRVDVYYY